MPRWDSSRARTLQLDINFNRRGPAAAAAGSTEPADRHRRRRAQRPQDVRVLDSGESSHPAPAAGGGDWPSEYDREADGGLRIIDDAEFPAPPSAYPSLASGYGSAAAGSLAAGYGGAARQRQQQQRGGGGDDFPSLSVAAVAADGSGGGSSRPPPLVKKVAKCPCGR